MTKFHINWITGNAQSCTSNSCEETHYESADDARSAYEAKMSKFLLPPAWNKTRRPR